MGIFIPEWLFHGFSFNVLVLKSGLFNQVPSTLYWIPILYSWTRCSGNHLWVDTHHWTSQKSLRDLYLERMLPQNQTSQGVTQNQMISEYFLRWISKRYGASGHLTFSQGCDQRASGGQQKSGTLPCAAIWYMLSFGCLCSTRTSLD